VTDRYCPNCGAAVEAGDNKCANCAAEFRIPPETGESESTCASGDSGDGVEWLTGEPSKRVMAPPLLLIGSAVADFFAGLAAVCCCLFVMNGGNTAYLYGGVATLLLVAIFSWRYKYVFRGVIAGIVSPVALVAGIFALCSAGLISPFPHHYPHHVHHLHHAHKAVKPVKHT